MKLRARQRLCLTLSAVLLCAVLLGVPPMSLKAWAETPPAFHEPAYEVLEVYMEVEEALALFYPDAERFETKTVSLTEPQLEDLSRRVGYTVTQQAHTVYEALSAEALLGYAVMLDEVGKFHEITFMAAIGTDRRVQQVEVLVYRESRGNEVKHSRFLNQYVGKGSDAPLRINKDIINITGATLSVRALNRGVRKALGLVEVLGGNQL